jgi:hypothetical protein
MEFALWTRGAVMQLIERQCGVKLPVRAVGNHLCSAEPVLNLCEA